MPPKRDAASFGQHLPLKDSEILHQGWVLKKKKKKMQGYAKRYLVLTKEGLLTYSISPEKPTRDAIKIPHASVTTSKRNGTIHVDSGSAVFHIKMLATQDFDAWTSNLRSFIPETPDGTKKRIYIASHDGKDLEPVDLSHLFESSQSVGDLIQAAKNKIQQMLKDKVDQPSVMSMVMPDNEESPLAQLSALIDSLSNEHANLEHTIHSKIPAADVPVGTMESMKSRGGSAARRMSVSSFQTTRTDEATFFDADAFDDEESSRDESSGIEDEDDEDDDSGAEDDGKPVQGGGAVTGSASGGAATQYRRVLPSKVSGDEVSLFSMLKKNVGKDLSTVSFPVSFNCPLSLLQAAAEEFEYAPDLLERAAKATDDWVERICLVSAFAVSSYSSTKLRASRKPFNPLLGETFECVREDKNLRFIAEKVVHQPPVTAIHAEGKGWQCNGWSSVKNKFWGKSLELIPEGDLRLEFDDGDVFTFSKPSSFMRNLLAGNKYLEHVGELTVTNAETGQRAVLEFKEGSMWGSSASRNQVVGTVYDEKGKKISSLKGKWTDNLSRLKESDTYQMLWEANDMPDHAEEYYGFTYFAMSLNEITKDIEGKLPPTDSRLRPDQRAFEEGNVDKAEELKQQLEGAQRERRKEGKAPNPHWFHEDKSETPSWQYGGSDGTTYFKTRAKVFGDQEKMKKESGQESSAGKLGSAEAWQGSPAIFEMN